jgi:hypothetical protein
MQQALDAARIMQLTALQAHQYRRLHAFCLTLEEVKAAEVQCSIRPGGDGRQVQVEQPVARLAALRGIHHQVPAMMKEQQQ